MIRQERSDQYYCTKPVIGSCAWCADSPQQKGLTLEEWAASETLTTSCECIQHARYHLSQAQKLNELDGMQGHAFFTLGCAVNSLINHIDGKHDPL